MMNANDFKQQEIESVLGDFSNDFDIDGIFEKMYQVDGMIVLDENGFSWKDGFDIDYFNSVISEYEI